MRHVHYLLPFNCTVKRFTRLLRLANIAGFFIFWWKTAFHFNFLVVVRGWTRKSLVSIWKPSAAIKIWGKTSWYSCNVYGGFTAIKIDKMRAQHMAVLIAKSFLSYFVFFVNTDLWWKCQSHPRLPTYNWQINKDDRILYSLVAALLYGLRLCGIPGLWLWNY
jgi:hypothetical protein